MRSRYAAYVRRHEGYLLRTWHPRTRPARVSLEESPDWQGLTVLATADGRYDDRTGEVEFRAAHDGGVLHERSRFMRRAGHWVYVDGDALD
jgi:SEC-C motif-containing protein